MEYELNNMSWTEFAERIKTEKVAILPVGACEVCGPQNPLGTDILASKKLACLVAEKTRSIVAPCIEVGQSKTLTSFPGTVAISSETLMAVYRELIDNLVRLGFKSVFVINSHKHNSIALLEVLEDARVKYGIKYGMVDVWQYIPIVTKSLGIWESSSPYSHASEAQTSLLLHMYPELVDMSKAVATPIKPDKYPGITQCTPFIELTETGVKGDGTVATAEKGRRATEACVEAIATYIEEILK